LAPWDQLKVSKANHIYDFVASLIHQLLPTQKIIIIENPRNSWLWQQPKFAALLDFGFLDVDFQHCKWCASSAKCRAKWTRLRTNCSALQQLAGPCRQSHTHLPWGFRDNTFATAGEAEYHAEMVQAVSSILCTEVSRRGYALVADDPGANISTSQPHKRRRAATNKQPRGKQLPAVISEFKEVIKTPTADFNASNKCLKFLRSESDGGEPAKEFVIAGVFRTPKEFLAEAKSSIHPADLPGSIPDELALTILGMLESSPKEYANQILNKVRELSKLVHDLREEDKAFIDTLDVDAQLIMKGKRIASLEALRRKIGWQDKDILDQVFRGVDITGLQTPVSGFNQELTLPTCSVPELRLNSVWSNKAMATRTRSCGCPDTDRSFWDAQMNEVAKDWLRGPFDSIDEVSQILGETPHVSRRFPLVQGPKVRGIDDLTESGVNSTFGTSNKLWLMDIDSIAATIRLLEDIIVKGTRQITLRSGIVKPFKVHPSWLQVPWQGKVTDLSQAYKQLFVSLKDRWAAVISVFDPNSGRAKFFLQVSLPFGARGSVNPFNRASRLLWAVGLDTGLIWLNFFDDYPTFCPGNVSHVVRPATKLLFNLLGWQFADSPEKDLEFAADFVALGVVFDISRLEHGLSQVKHKPKRASEVKEQLYNVLAEGSFSATLAASLRGKLQFMESATFGNAARGAYRVFRHADTVAHKLLNREDRETLHWLVAWLDYAPPRLVSPGFQGKPLLLFSDGACEYVNMDRKLSCGAVLYDPRDNALLMFGFEVPQALGDVWASDGRKQLVTECEILPQLIARRLWAKRLAGSNVLSFVDSEPAKFGLIKGMSDTRPCDILIRSIALWDSEATPWIWYSRVPSFSNIADEPSRLLFDKFAKEFPDALLCDASDYVPPPSEFE
jgi:hypothetical protein